MSVSDHHDHASIWMSGKIYCRPSYFYLHEFQLHHFCKNVPKVKMSNNTITNQQKKKKSLETWQLSPALFLLSKNQQGSNPSPVIYSLDGNLLMQFVFEDLHLSGELVPIQSHHHFLKKLKCIAGPWDSSSLNSRSSQTGLRSHLPHLWGLAALYILPRWGQHPQVDLLLLLPLVPQRRFPKPLSPFLSLHLHQHLQNGRKKQYSNICIINVYFPLIFASFFKE